MDPSDVLDNLPLKKRATPKELIYLLVGVAILFVAGWSAKGYFDTAHQETVMAIQAVATSQAEKLVEARADLDRVDSEHERLLAVHTQALESIKRYMWSNAEMQRWAVKLERDNRDLKLNVPDVPAPTSVSVAR